MHLHIEMFVKPSSSVGYALIALTRALPICPYPLLPRTTGCTFNREHLFPRLFRHADWAGKALHHGAINLKPTAQLRSSIGHVASKFSWNFARNYYFPSVVKTLCFPVFCTQENAISYPLIHETWAPWFSRSLPTRVHNLQVHKNPEIIQV